MPKITIEMVENWELESLADAIGNCLEIECRDCGCDFIRSERDEIICPDCAAAADPDFIPPGIEVFYRTRKENQSEGWTDSDGQPLGAGWYWWACFPGCLPDSDPFGPFDSEREAIDDCKGF